MPRLQRVLADRVARAVLAVALGGIAAVAMLGVTSRTHGPVGPGRVELRVGPGGSGRTELVLPPLGRVTARTHDAPLTLTAEVEQLDVSRVQALASEDDPTDALRADAADGFEQRFRHLVLKSLALSALVGIAATALAPGRRWHHLPFGALGGVVGTAMALAAVWRGFDPGEFERSPRFEGALEEAPALLETIQRHVDDVDVVRSRIAVLGARVAELYTAAAEDDAVGTEGTRILHVSDVHSNPLGVEVVNRLVNSFGADVVLDTGDLTSFGSPVEARIAELIDDIDVPYLLVPGNHDSPANRSSFDAVPHIEVLDGSVRDVDGLRVMGVGDPTYTASNDVDTARANEQKDMDAARVARLVRRHDPDVLAVHDPRQAQDAVGEVALVVAGHTHERSAVSREDTLVLTVGSTGATGLGSLTADSDLAYEAQVLHFSGARLVALDYISLTGFTGSFTVEHRVIEQDPGTASHRLPDPQRRGRSW